MAVSMDSQYYLAGILFAFDRVDGKARLRDSHNCVICGACIRQCPAGALEMS